MTAIGLRYVVHDVEMVAERIRDYCRHPSSIGVQHALTSALADAAVMPPDQIDELCGLLSAAEREATALFIRGGIEDWEVRKKFWSLRDRLLAPVDEAAI